MKKYKSVRALLRDPNRWTRHAMARDAAGHVVDEDSPEAVCFCLIGAVARVYGKNAKAFDKAKNKFYKANPAHPSMVSLNDDALLLPRIDEIGLRPAFLRQHARVLAAVRKAKI